MLRVSEPDLSELERDALIRAFDSTFISGVGEFVDECEKLIAKATGASHALVTCNGTASLHLALLALGIGPGDEVIVPSFTYIASVNAILYVGATPVFVDSSLDNWTILPDALPGSLSPRTKAIMGVHLYGHPFDYLSLSRFAKEHGLKLIEDAAEAPFSKSHGTRAGNMGDVASFSFFGNKVLTAGEGGAVTTNDSELFEKMKIIRNQGMDPLERFNHIMIGNNFRLNNLSAAILSAQLRRRSELLSKRQAISNAYQESLSEVDGISFQPISEWATWTPWLFSIILNPRANRSVTEVATHLWSHGIETRPFFKPAHLMTPYRNFPGSQNELPNAVKLASGGMNLPTSSLMNENEVFRVAELVSELLR